MSQIRCYFIESFKSLITCSKGGLSKAYFLQALYFLVPFYLYKHNVTPLFLEPSSSTRGCDWLDIPVAYLLSFNCYGDLRVAETEWTAEIVVPLLLPKLAFLPMGLLVKLSQFPPFATLSHHSSPG